MNEKSPRHLQWLARWDGFGHAVPLVYETSACGGCLTLFAAFVMLLAALSLSADLIDVELGREDRCGVVEGVCLRIV